MHKHEQKRCPHCPALFECESGPILLCQCQQAEDLLDSRQHNSLLLEEFA